MGKKTFAVLLALVLFIFSVISPKFLFAQGSASGTVTFCSNDSQCNSLEKCQGGVCISTVTGSGTGGGSKDILCGNGINTAIGCIPVLNPDNGNAFYTFILSWAIGIGGGIAFLLIVYAGFMIMTSSGNPERLKAGQELLTAAVSGLILLIFSVFILNFIGVKILKIPGVQ